MRLLRKRFVLSALVITLVMAIATGTVVAEDKKDGVFAKLRTVFEIVEVWHKDGADLDKFFAGAVKGGLEALGDPYTNYYSSEEYEAFLNSLNGSFSGIGAYLETEGKYIIIASPIKGSPAFRAGLTTGDRILEVDGVSVVGMAQELVVGKIRGPAGTEVTIKLERPSENRTYTVTITREQINIPNVEFSMLEGQIGYIQLMQFGEHSANDFFKAVNELKAKGAKGLVLDIRQNGGGYLDAATKIASGFVPAGKPVVWQVGKGGNKSATYSSGDLINLPTVVLVDKGSASASEIVAGAIQDYGLAPLVGTRTFGKGTVQQILTLTAGGGMKVTTAEYLTPEERHVHGVGLTPDYLVENPKPDLERTGPMEYTRMIGPNMVGLDVLRLQQRLQDLGYDPEVDGYVGMKTRNAVLQFAKHHGLPEEPIVDARFIEVLNEQVAKHARTVKPEDLQLKKALELLRQKMK